MAEMGLGYGSEYQLLRFLGHHRNFLEEQIRKNTNYNGKLHFLDFPSGNNRLSLDGEYVGIKFLEMDKTINYENIKKNWNNYWPNSPRGQQNWDAVIIHDDNEYILVEAKAHLDELESNISKDAKETSIQKINKAFEETKQRFNIFTENNWFKDYYQLANRIAFLNFLHKNNIKGSLLYIYFLNGYEKRKIVKEEIKLIESKSVKNKTEWEKGIKHEYEHLGISNSEVLKHIFSIYIDCKNIEK